MAVFADSSQQNTMFRNIMTVIDLTLSSKKSANVEKCMILLHCVPKITNNLAMSNIFASFKKQKILSSCLGNVSKGRYFKIYE